MDILGMAINDLDKLLVALSEVRVKGCAELKHDIEGKKKLLVRYKFTGGPHIEACCPVCYGYIKFLNRDEKTVLNNVTFDDVTTAAIRGPYKRW